MNEEYATLPPPAPNQTFSATKTRRVRTTDKRKTRPKKGLTQFNVKVTPAVKEAIQEAFEEALSSARKAGQDMTKGDFVGLMIAAYEAQKSKTDVAGAMAELRRPINPPKEDILAGRTVPIAVYATPALATALNDRAGKKQWTLGGTIEHACQVAVEAERPTKK